MKRNIYKHRINEYIRAHTVRVVYGEINKVMSIEDALALAEGSSLDLVEFGTGPCPTCKIIDYSKYRYQEERKQKLQEQNNKIKIKEVQMRPSIDKGDLETKINQVKSFLNEGSEVRIRLKLKGREKGKPKEHFSFLVNMVANFLTSLDDSMKIDMKDNPAGGTIILKPIKKT